MTPVEPHWRELLALACKHLEGVGLAPSDWTWGGGTVLMLRHQHRLSRDVDLFLNDVQHLTFLSPRLNDAIAADVNNYEEQANHLRCDVTGVGEIDFLVVAPVVDLEPERMEIESHGDLRVMTDREILAQKIYYRGAQFKGRDLFDFATVTALRPELLQDEKLLEVARIRKNALTARLDGGSLRQGYEDVIPHPEAKIAIPFDDARAGFLEWLGSEPNPPDPSSSGPD